MTNKPMLSVERELLESCWAALMQKGQVIKALELRALLDKPVLESQYEGMTQEQAQAVSDGVDEILHGKPAAQHQGILNDLSHKGPAAEITTSLVHYGKPSTAIPAAHKQPAPVYQVCDGVNGWIDVDLLRYTACCLDPEEYECRVLYAEQPAPLAVVMPERMDPRDPYD